MISNDAIAIMEETAKRVGFGYREDYPHRGKSPISAGDWKGDSVAVCVFNDHAHATRFISECLPQLDTLGDVSGGDVVRIPHASGNDMYVAVISGIDLVAKREVGEAED